jgi:hypothetical protein
VIFSDLQLFFSDGTFEAIEAEHDLSDDEDNLEPEFWTGNPNHKLWLSPSVPASLQISDIIAQPWTYAFHKVESLCRATVRRYFF